MTQILVIEQVKNDKDSGKAYAVEVRRLIAKIKYLYTNSNKTLTDKNQEKKSNTSVIVQV